MIPVTESIVGFFQWPVSSLLGIIRRAHAEIFAKALGEVARRRESHFVGHFAHSLVGAGEEFGRFLETRDADQFNGRIACERLHFAVELGASEAHVGGEILHAEV